MMADRIYRPVYGERYRAAISAEGEDTARRDGRTPKLARKRAFAASSVAVESRMLRCAHRELQPESPPATAFDVKLLVV